MNDDSFEQMMQNILVLIDTWWNVNKKLDEVFRLSSPVLIDTWWNVNKEGIAFSEYIGSF